MLPLASLLLAASLVPANAPAATASPRELTFEERVKARAAIEQVYGSHRIWPAENGTPKPPLSRLMPESAIRAKVEDDLRKSNALERGFGRPVTAADLQRELDRMLRETRRPEVLRELFAALGNDPFVVAEALARPLLVDRLLRRAYARQVPLRASTTTTFETWWRSAKGEHAPTVPRLEGAYTLRVPVGEGCVPDTWTPIGSSVPGPRSGHTAVWTGAEMIVWGGTDGLYRNTGGRYDPATSSWAPISNGANAPSARTGHTAVWTGSEMIVWGGGDQHGLELGDGGRYDPSTDTWTPTSTGNGCPTARAGHTAVWTGTRMIVWGGASTFFTENSGARYDPVTDAWSATSTAAPVPARRRAHTAVWTGTEMIVWGGYDAGGLPLDSGGRYDPAADVWTPTSRGANVPAARALHEVVWTGTEMIVWGGYAQYSMIQSGGRYNPTTDTWLPTSTGANVPSPRTGPTAVWTGSEMIVWGGFTGSPYVNDGARYAPATDTWTPTSLGSNVPYGRSGHSAVWTGAEMIVWGGYGTTPLNSGGRYDPVSDSWQSTADADGPPDARNSHVAVWTGAEMIVWGGGGESELLDSGGRYDPATGTWTPTSRGVNVPSPRFSPSAVWTGTEMVVWGGHDGHDAVITGGRYSPFTDSWRPTSTGANVPHKRPNPTAVWTGREMIVWGGGDSLFGFRNDGGRYDPSTDTWAPVATAPWSPSARSGHTAVWSGLEMIVWGGFNSTGSLNSGGRYSPAADSWTATPTEPWAPSARSGHLAVWTGEAMIVWGDGDGNTDTGGRYWPDRGEWATTSQAPPAPGGRRGATATWTGEEMVVWGGVAGSLPVNTGSRYRAGTDSWTEMASAPGLPTARSFHTAVWTGLEMLVWGTDGGGDRYCVVNCTAPRGLQEDRDRDGLHNTCDDCPDAYDPDQSDFDGDRVGDLCESGAVAADVDRSLRVDGFDLSILGRAFGSVDGEPAYDRRADLNRDGRVDGEDLAVIAAAFGRSVVVS